MPVTLLSRLYGYDGCVSSVETGPVSADEDEPTKVVPGEGCRHLGMLLRGAF